MYEKIKFTLMVLGILRVELITLRGETYLHIAERLGAAAQAGRAPAAAEVGGKLRAGASLQQPAHSVRHLVHVSPPLSPR
jgi:hypothetical protein